ncbi:trigger factor [Candidatus Peribacteria bacterium]|nr:trigger factor [Candidatus Peribacteria bacterium]
MPTLTPPQKLKQSRVQATVTFTADEAKAAEAKAVEKLGEGVRIEGFRPGRAPADMIRSKINPEAINEETVRMLLPGAFDSLMKEHTIQPIIPPRVDMVARDPMTLTITFVERPEVKVKGAEKISVKKKESKVEEKDIEQMVGYLRGQYRTTTPVDRPSKESDEVTLDFVGTADGKEVEGTRANGYKVTIGSKSLLPGFEEAITGLKKGEQKTFTLTFPDSYHAKHLQGKPVVFAVTIQDIAEVQLPELTDAFVKEHHLGESAKELRDRVSQSLREQEDRAFRGEREKELFEAIRSATVIDLAPELVTHEERMILDEIARNLEKDKMPMDEWLKQTNRTMEAFKKELNDEADKRLTLRFAIQWLMDEKKIEMTQEELTTAVADILKSVPEAQHTGAEAFYKEGGEGYEELKWRKRVEKLVEGMLAA